MLSRTYRQKAGSCPDAYTSMQKVQLSQRNRMIGQIWDKILDFHTMFVLILHTYIHNQKPIVCCTSPPVKEIDKRASLSTFIIYLHDITYTMVFSPPPPTRSRHTPLRPLPVGWPHAGGHHAPITTCPTPQLVCTRCCLAYTGPKNAKNNNFGPALPDIFAPETIYMAPSSYSENLEAIVLAVPEL